MSNTSIKLVLNIRECQNFYISTSLVSPLQLQIKKKKITENGANLSNYGRAEYLTVSESEVHVIPPTVT
jgi:hypothetical protein